MISFVTLSHGTVPKLADALYDVKVRRRGLATYNNIIARPVRCDSLTLKDRACQPLQIGSLGGLITHMVDGIAVVVVVLL